MQALRSIVCIAILGTASASLAAGGGGGGGDSGFSGSSPKELALARFQSGEKYRRAGLEALESAESAATEEARKEALEKSTAKFKRALREYREATRKDRTLHLAWNGMGFSQRMLGDYEAALNSYDRALELEPGFPNAVEYRGEAYLRLGRIEDAKAAYLDLFGRERPLADLLLRKMQTWLADAKSQPQAPGTQAALDAFASWVAERAALAQQTARLAPAPSEHDVASW